MNYWYLAWLDALRDVLPQPILDTLDTLYYHVVNLAQRYGYFTEMSFPEVVAALHLQTILPPLISLITIYFALLSLYRTTTFFVRTTLFFVKWGALIGFMGVGLRCIMTGAFPEPLNSLFKPYGNARPKPARRGPKPRAWDSFEEHRRWREGKQDESPFAAEAGKVAQDVANKIVDTARRAAGQDGWLGTISGLAAKAFVGDMTESPPTQGKKRTKDTKSKGKAKSR